MCNLDKVVAGMVGKRHDQLTARRGNKGRLSKFPDEKANGMEVHLR